MNKSVVVDRLRVELRSRRERMLEAFESARDGATGDDARAESKYDTRGLESSYLAAGQAEQVEELAEAVRLLEAAEFRAYEFDEPIGPGALVEVERDGEFEHYLLAPAGGGIVVNIESGESVTVLGPSAPLRGKLLGREAGERIEDPALVILEIF